MGIKDMEKTNVLLDRIVAMTAAALDVETSGIKTDIHIQNLGFTSIELVKLTDLLSEALGEEIHPGVFFEYTTLERFQSYLLEEKADAVAKYLAMKPANGSH